MTNPILIAGASGVTGGHAAKLLLEKGLPVRALVRTDDERAQKLKALGAEIFVADLLDFRAIRRAFEGVILGKPVQYEQISGAEWVKEVFNSDMAFGVQHVTAITEMQALGQMAGTNDVIEKITGRRAQPEFNRSSQRPCGLIGDARQMPRQASSSQGSCAAWC
jgi:uncharacterized protein YbjT (DUF2867 family)